MSEIASAYVSLLPSARGFGRATESQIGSELKGSGKRLGGAMSKTMKVGLLAGVAGVGAVVTASLFKGFNRLSAIDQARAKLDGLGNSAKAVDKIMNNALASVKGTAFGLDEAATTAASVVAAGIKPGAQLTAVLKTVADTATIAGKSMADTGAIFGSVAARGKLQGDDLMQLQSAGVPVLAMLAKHYGVTAAAASEMVTKGKVDFKNFSTALHEGLGGAALASGKTVVGAWSNIQAAAGRLGASLLSGVFAKIPGALSGVTAKLDGLGPVATRMGEALGRGVSSAASALQSMLKVVMPVATSLAHNLMPALSAIGGFMKKNPTVVKVFAITLGVLAGAIWLVTSAATALSVALTANPVGLIVVGIAALAAGMVYAYKKSSEFRSIVQQIGVVALQFGGWLKTNVLPVLIQLAQSIGTSLKPVLASIGKVFREDVLPVLQQVIAKFRQWQPTIQKVIGFAIRLEAKWLSFEAKIAGKVIPVIVRLAGFMIGKVVPAVAKVIGKVIGFQVAIIGAAVKAGQFAVRVGKAVAKTVAWFAGLPGRITAKVGQLGSLLYQAGKDVINGLERGIDEAWNSIKDKVAEIGHKVASVVKKALKINSPSLVFKAIGQSVGEGLDLGIRVSGKRVYAGATKVTAGLLKRFHGVGAKSVAAFSKGIRGTEGQASKAVDKIMSAITGSIKSKKNKDGISKAAADSMKHLVNAISKQAKLVRTLKGKRNDLVSQVASSLRDQFSLSDLASSEPNQFGFTAPVTAKSIVVGAQAIAARLKKLATRLRTLGKKGMPGSLLQQIAGLGSTQGLAVADAFLSDPSQIKALRTAYNQIGTYSKSGGVAVGNATYDKQIAAQEKRFESMLGKQAQKKHAKEIGDAVASALGKHPLVVRADGKVVGRLYIEGQKAAGKYA